MNNTHLSKKMIELVDSSEFQKDKVKYIKFIIKKYCQWQYMKYLLYVVLWLIGGRISIKFGVQGIYVVLSGIAIIFSNLGTRENGQLSAYSIFNEGYKRLLGETTEEDFGYGNQNKKKQIIEDDQEQEQETTVFDNLKPDEMILKINKLGNLKCFCNSGRKYKKCHYYIHLREKQELEKQIKDKQH